MNLKKGIKKSLIAYTVLLATLTFYGCGFGENLKEYFEEYTGEAGIVRHVFDNDNYPVNNKGITCIGSSTDKTISFLIRNPQQYNFGFEYIFDNEDLNNLDPSNILSFDQPNNYSASLTFKSDFLKNIDKGLPGTKDISGKIRLSQYDKEGNFIRYFDELYKLPVNANSNPPKIRYAMIQRKGARNTNGSVYVVCFCIQKLNSTVHENDTKDLYINNEHWIFNSSVNTLTPADDSCTNLTLTDPGVLNLTVTESDLSKLSSADLSIFKSVIKSTEAKDYVPLYYITDKNPEASEGLIEYSVSIKDKDGLETKVIISNRADKLKNPTVNVSSTSSNYPADDKTGYFNLCLEHSKGTFGWDEDSKQFNKEGTPLRDAPTIVYKVTKDDILVFDGEGSAPVNLALPVGKNYKLTAYATAPALIDSDEIGESITFNVTRSANYYVSAEGSSAGTGYIGNPYRTIEECLTDIRMQQSDGYGTPEGGYVINLLSDIYAQDSDISVGYYININNIKSAPVTIKGYNKVFKIDGNKKGGVITGQNSELTLSNIEITGGLIQDNNMQGAGIRANSLTKLILNNVKIHNNTIENETSTGAGIFTNSSNISISGKNYILNNKANNNENNLVLSTPDGDQQSTLIIEGNLKGSSIGITTRTTPTTESGVTFTNHYGYKDGYNKNLSPDDIFISDTGHGISYDEQSGEVVLTLAGGVIKDYEDINFMITADSTASFKTGTSKTITFTVMEGATNISNSCSYEYTVKQSNNVVTKGYTCKNNTITFNNTVLPGTYTIFVTVTYKSEKRMGQFIVKVTE